MSRETVLALKPCLTWEFDTLTIRAGVNWLTLQGEGEAVRIRGEQPLKTAAGALETLLDPDSGYIVEATLAPGVTMRYLLGNWEEYFEVTLGEGHATARYEAELCHRLSECSEWLAFLDNRHKTPLYCGLIGADLIGRTLRVERQTDESGHVSSTLFAFADPGQLRDRILAAVSGRSPGGPTPTPPHADVAATDTGLALSDGDKTVPLGHLALLHVAVLLDGAANTAEPAERKS